MYFLQISFNSTINLKSYIKAQFKGHRIAQVDAKSQAEFAKSNSACPSFRYILLNCYPLGEETSSQSPTDTNIVVLYRRID